MTIYKRNANQSSTRDFNDHSGLIRVKTRVKEMNDPTRRVGSCGSWVIKIANTDPI